MNNQMNLFVEKNTHIPVWILFSKPIDLRMNEEKTISDAVVSMLNDLFLCVKPIFIRPTQFCQC